MREILIVRHAKSSWKYDKLDDSERPLNKRGKRDAVMMGERLGAQGLIPDTVIISATQRTLATAVGMLNRMGKPVQNIHVDDCLFMGDVAAQLALLRALPDTLQRPMLVGHHTGCPGIVSVLTGQAEEAMPTCAVACVRVPIDHWCELTEGSGTLVHYDYPKREC